MWKVLLPALPSAVEPSTTQLTLLSPLARSLVDGGAGADSFVFTAGATGPVFWLDPAMTPSTSVMAIPIATTTYYFGKTDGKDTLSFATTTAGKPRYRSRRFLRCHLRCYLQR